MVDSTETEQNIRWMKYIVNFILGVFVVISGFLMIYYLLLILEKINRPQFKNLNEEQFVWYGIFILTLLIIDFFIIRRWNRMAKNSDR